MHDQIAIEILRELMEIGKQMKISNRLKARELGFTVGELKELFK